MKTLAFALKVALLITVMAVLVAGMVTFAARPDPGASKCPRNIYCADVWMPVICADGIVYSNDCYAYRACAPKPCVPYGGDTM